MKNPPRRLDIFEPVSKMPKQVLDAALVLASPNPPRVAIFDAVELLDAEGMARAPGCSLNEILLSAIQLAMVVGKKYAMLSPDFIELQVTHRIQAVRKTNGNVGGDDASGSPRPAPQRDPGRSW